MFVIRGTALETVTVNGILQEKGTTVYLSDLTKVFVGERLIYADRLNFLGYDYFRARQFESKNEARQITRGLRERFRNEFEFEILPFYYHEPPELTEAELEELRRNEEGDDNG